MVRLGPWLAPVLTLSALGAALGAVLDSQHVSLFAIAAAVIVAGSLAAFIRHRQRNANPDWTLTAPAILGITLLASETPVGLGIGGLLLVAGLVASGLASRQRDVKALAEATSASAWLVAAGLLSLVAAIGGAHGARVWLPVAALWLLVWMPSATRSVRDQRKIHLLRRPEEVSAYLLDQRNLPAWYEGYERCELLDGHQLGPGAVFNQVVKQRGRSYEARVTVDEYEPGQRLCTSVVGSRREASSCYTFSADQDGTLAAYEFAGEQAYAAALIGTMLLMRATLRKVSAQRQAAFDNLKAVLEA